MPSGPSPNPDTQDTEAPGSTFPQPWSQTATRQVAYTEGLTSCAQGGLGQAGQQSQEGGPARKSLGLSSSGKAWCGLPVVLGCSEEGGGLCSQQCVLEAEARHHHVPSQPPTPPFPIQGYKMDDLLTSYVQQLLSTMNKQQGSQAPAQADL